MSVRSSESALSRTCGREYSFHTIDPLTGVPIIAALSCESSSCCSICGPSLYFQSCGNVLRRRATHGSFQELGMSAGNTHCGRARQGAADHGKYSRNRPGPQRCRRAERVGERPASRDWTDAYRDHRSKRCLCPVGTAGRSLRTSSRSQGFPEVQSAGNHPERKRDCHHSGSSRCGRRESGVGGECRRSIDSGYGDQPGQDGFRARSS